MNDLREQIAAREHDQWIGWMFHMFNLSRRNPDGSITVPADRMTRWLRLMYTPYAELSEQEKESDREEADKVLAIISPYDGD